MNAFLIVYLCILISKAMINTVLKYAWQWSPDRDEPWYNHRTEIERQRHVVIRAFTDFLAFMVLFNYIIPVSMYVTVEMQKFLGSYFITWDEEMFDEELGQGAQVNTSDLNEELGQVEYVFTDKTGTLTENNMEFIECCVDGNVYIPHAICNGQILSAASSIDMIDSSPGGYRRVKEEETVDGIKRGIHQGRPTSFYISSSPDEVALVEGMKREQRLAQAYDVIERDFVLLGATAVEDRLVNAGGEEAVPTRADPKTLIDLLMNRLQEKAADTIESLHKAGIKVWVLTGDKMETAAATCYASKLFRRSTQILELTKKRTKEQSLHDVLFELNRTVLRQRSISG
ncbi:hypothetical protein GOODEAATRI_002782 [Goodea atripinnis]|uniref:P-type phospholipid transporter n=1 Tax=Goodea atripinnis TaxID=208336 RepID=A0ABV0NUM7_9TELE